MTENESSERWGEMLDVLKDISTYLSKESDAELEKTELEKAPKISEQAKPIVGGTSSGKPGEDVIKAEEDKEEDKDEAVEEVSEDEDEKSDNDEEELKSILKDIRNALVVRDQTIAKAVLSELQKAMPKEIDVSMHKMLRKMGFSPSRQDVVKLGVDEIPNLTDVKKSEDEAEDMKKTVDSLAKKSWGELGNLRQATGLFRVF